MRLSLEYAGRPSRSEPNLDQLYTPWRMPYIKRKRASGSAACVFCDIPSRDEATPGNLILARGADSYAVLNRYPYTFGHTLVVPYAHRSSPESLPMDTLAEVMSMSNRVMRVLSEIANPDGFNIGANIGAAAGAGIAAHFHFHIVPRWAGDANFMVSIGDTQTIAAELSTIHQQMRQTWRALYGAA